MNLIIQVSDWYSQDWIYYPKDNYTFADSLLDYNMKRLLLGLETTLKLELIPEEPHFFRWFSNQAACKLLLQWKTKDCNSSI